MPLKIGTDLPSFPGTSVNIAVYRIGYYGGKGARLIAGAGATNVKVNNTFQCNPANTTTGETSCSNWNVSYTIPGSKLPISGIYEAVFTDVADGGIAELRGLPGAQRHRVASNILYVLPTRRLRGLQHVGLQVAVLRRLRRRQHDLRRRPGSRGLLRPSARRKANKQ